jgi:hypothetical protein
MPINESGDTSSTCNRSLKCLQVLNFVAAHFGVAAPPAD